MGKDLLKVLNSEAKMNILRELAKGQRTPTDLSKKLGKVKSTVVEHLEELVDLGLVIKSEEPGRKWVFYSLSKQGYRLLEGKPRIYEFLLPSSIISIFLGLVFLFQKQPTQKLYAVSETATTTYQPTTIIAYSLILLGIVGLIFHFIKVKKHE
jgi:DNA-binding transcriptional ArsR family regulator